MNAANPQVEKVFEATVELFQNAGFQVSKGSNSITDYGHSRYIYVNCNGALTWNLGQGALIRISDHSTGDRRILSGDESFIMVNNADVDMQQVFHKFNYFFNPSQYSISEQPMSAMISKENVRGNELRATDVVVNSRTSKRGEVMYNVSRMNNWTIIRTTHIASGYAMANRTK
jgi:hypothetical protein